MLAVLLEAAAGGVCTCALAPHCGVPADHPEVRHILTHSVSHSLVHSLVHTHRGLTSCLMRFIVYAYMFVCVCVCVSMLVCVCVCV